MKKKTEKPGNIFLNLEKPINNDFFAWTVDRLFNESFNDVIKSQEMIFAANKVMKNISKK